MNRCAVVLADSGGDSGSPVPVVVLCLLLVVGLVQVVRPQWLWRANRNLQRGWVRDPDATEPTRRGYAMQRVSGVLFLGLAAWMLVQQVS